MSDGGILSKMLMTFTVLKPGIIVLIPPKLFGLQQMDTLTEVLSRGTTIGSTTGTMWRQALVLGRTITTSTTGPSSSGLTALTLLESLTELKKQAKTSQF